MQMCQIYCRFHSSFSPFSVQNSTCALMLMTSNVTCHRRTYRGRISSSPEFVLLRSASPATMSRKTKFRSFTIVCSCSSTTGTVYLCVSSDVPYRTFQSTVSCVETIWNFKLCDFRFRKRAITFCIALSHTFLGL